MPLDKPFEKSAKTVTFVGEDGQVLEVISNISKGALAILKKQGYKKQSERFKEQEEEALKKADSTDADEDEDDEDEDEDEHDPPQPPSTSTGPDLAAVKKAAPAKAPGRRT